MSPFESDPSRVLLEGTIDVYIAIDAVTYALKMQHHSTYATFTNTTAELEALKPLFELADSTSTAHVDAAGNLSVGASADVLAALQIASSAANPILSLLANDAYKEFCEQLFMQ